MDDRGAPGRPGPPLRRPPRQGPRRPDQHRANPTYALAERFADEWDQTAFDPGYHTLPLEHFEPLVRRTFAAPRRI